MKNFTYALGDGINESPEFEKKGLAEFAVNVGLHCGHDYTYCSSRAMLRRRTAFNEVGKSLFPPATPLLTPTLLPRSLETPSGSAAGAGELCTTVDAWAPEAQKLGLGRRCLEAILAEPGWTIRILTKNAAVVQDFDLIKKHKDRVLVGLSRTGTSDKDGVLAVVEPHASPVSERMAALKTAHKMGLRTYGMLCTRLPLYPDTGLLKTHVHLRPLNKRLFIELEPTDHSLAVEQRNGITMARVREIAAALLHPEEE